MLVGPDASSAAVARILQEQFSQAKSSQLETAPRARHFVMYDDPQWMFEKVDHFHPR